MIETSGGSIDGEDTMKEPLIASDSKEATEHQPKDSETQLRNQRPITSKLRTAVRHLRQVAGPLSPFRGFHISIIYHALHNLTLGFVASRSSTVIRSLLSILITVMLHRVHMVWTHTMISMPTTKSWWRRVLPLKLSKAIILPTAIWAAAQQICLYIPGTLSTAAYYNLHHPQNEGADSSSIRKVALIQAIAILAIFIITIFLIVIPAEVSLKRIEASLLPETEETIIPFDRSLTGKAQPSGGSVNVTVIDAWRTFGKEARIRLIKLYGKVFAIQAALAILFTTILAAELRVLSGNNISTLIEAARNSMKIDL